MLNKYIYVFLLVISACCVSNAQDTIIEPDLTKRIHKDYKHHIGINIGTFSGSGFAYKYQPDKYGLQITVMPPLGPDYLNSFSLVGLYRIKEGHYFNLSAFASAGIGTFIATPTVNVVPVTFKETNGSGNFGAGFGIESNNEHINFMLMCGYGVYDLDYSIVSLEFGLFYRFN